MNRLWAGLLLSTCVACAPPLEAELQPLDVDIVVVGSATVAFDLLRVAIRFEGQAGEIEMGSDIAITSTGTLQTIRFEPPNLTRGRGSDLSWQFLGTREGVPLGWPRLVAYLDHNRSGRLEAGPESVDQIVGADSQQRRVGWLFDTEATLATLSAEGIEGYYQVTGGRYTPFVLASGGLLSADDEVPPEPGIVIDASQLSIVNSDLLCGGFLRNGSEVPAKVELLVDLSLDPAIVCGLDIADCRPVDTSTLTAPVIPSPTGVNPVVRATAQCRRRLGVELLVIENQRIRCTDRCVCTNHTTIEAVATSTAAEMPAWWPCGDTLSYCDSDLPLYRVDPECDRPDE